MKQFMLNFKNYDLSFLKKHQTMLSIIGLFVFSLCLRLLFLHLNDRLAKDAYSYIKYAELLYQSDWDWNKIYFAKGGVGFPPLLTFVMAWGIPLGVGAKVMGIAFCIILGSLVPVGVYCCGIQVFHHRLYVLFAALLISLHSYSIKVSANILRDAPYHCLLLFSLAIALYAIREQKVKYWLIFGFFAGVATLIRKEGLELLLVAIGWQIIVIFKPVIGCSLVERFILSGKVIVFISVGFSIIALSVWLSITSMTNGCGWTLVPGMAQLWRLIGGIEV